MERGNCGRVKERRGMAVVRQYCILLARCPKAPAVICDFVLIFCLLANQWEDGELRRMVG